MKVFHSSILQVKHPSIRFSRDFLDFGRGFYLTTMRQQAIAKMMKIDEATAMDIFYNSDTMQLINDGVGDLHCRSDLYLAEEIIREYTEKQ